MSCLYILEVVSGALLTEGMQQLSYHPGLDKMSIFDIYEKACFSWFSQPTNPVALPFAPHSGPACKNPGTTWICDP